MHLDSPYQLQAPTCLSLVPFSCVWGGGDDSFCGYKGFAPWCFLGAGHLDDVTITSARPGPGVPVAWVESCSCPMGYEGQFCERCTSGYWRESPSLGPYSPCVPCTCNGHSETCDPETGKRGCPNREQQEGGSSFLGWTVKQNSRLSLFQVCAIAGITRQGLTVRSAVMGITVMLRLAQPRTASLVHAQASRAVPLCPAPRRLCAPAARLALQVCSYRKHLFLHAHGCGNVSC